MSRTLHLFGTDWGAMMVPIQVIRWYRMQCYDGTDSCAIVVPIRRYCHNGEDNSFVMLRTAFVDENILAFQLDGTDRYAFMIDENNKALFAPKTLEELNTYLVDKLDKEKQKQIEQQNKDNELAEKAKQEANRERAEKIKAEIQIKYQDSKKTKAIIFGVLGFLLYVLAADACLGLRDWLGSVLSLIFAITSTCFCIYYYKQGEHAFKQKIKEYKDNNPNDPCVAYL